MVGEKQLIPESGTTERREWMRKIARKGGSVSAAESRARAKFRKLVNSMLDIPVNWEKYCQKSALNRATWYLHGRAS